MKYLNKGMIMAALVAVTLISGCKKTFLDVNDDPNRVTESNITPELIFPQAANSVGARAASGNFTFLNNWMGYWSTSGSFAIDQTETTYNVSFSFTDPLWQNHYNTLFDLYQAKTKSIAKGDSVLAGASIILSVKLWQELVDMFGDIPYTQAFSNSQYTQPTYDKAKDVYRSLQLSLDTAVTYMGKASRSTFSTVDIVNGGNKTKWIKFANTLRLRLLIRQSEVAGFNPASEIAKIYGAGGVGVLGSGESVTVNPGYSNTTGKQSPFYANYGLTPTGAEASTVVRANNYFVNLLTSTSDPRLSRFFKAPTAGGGITGTAYGLAAGNPDGAHSSGIGPGLANNAAQNQWIYPAYESLFLEAEAIARGWTTGTAQTAYEKAVTESFLWLGVPNAVNAAGTYLANTSIAQFSNAGTTPLSRAKFIAYQKYIANAGVDPLESWSDQRRLNFLPNNGYITVNPNKISSVLPVRLPYPQSEYTTNAGNVTGEGTVNLFTSKIFWQP